jgi:hypothetical protein
LDCDCISAKNAFSACSAPIPPIEQGCRKSAFVARAPNPGFFTHVAQRFASIESSQLAWVVCKRSQFEAQFTLRQEADDERFLGSAGRAAKQFCQGLEALAWRASTIQIRSIVQTENCRRVQKTNPWSHSSDNTRMFEGEITSLPLVTPERRSPRRIKLNLQDSSRFG